MFIECVIVSVNYSDILSHTLPHNKQFFDKTIVVTDTKDYLTYNLCRQHNVECIQTDVFYNKGARFDKGAGITEGLKCLSKKEWVLHLDADIWLHPFCMRQLKNLTLNSQHIYGCDRIMIESFEDWIDFLNHPNIWNDEFWQLELGKYKIGNRISLYYNQDAWCPLGFFQLWNPGISGVDIYPSFNDASSSDIIFAQQFSRIKRTLIPEMLAVHIEQGISQTGTNWQGRKELNFFPKCN